MYRDLPKRAVTALIAILFVFLVFPPVSFAEEDRCFVLAASDFQEGSHTGSAAVVSQIADSIKNQGFTGVDGFLFCGDYDRNTIGNATETTAGLTMLDETVSAAFPSIESKVYVQGNHDPADHPGLSASGANDTDRYGVFVINNKDYMWYNSDETTIRQTAASLRSYLAEKEEAGYTKPIFIVSHLPLHYSMRTSCDGDAQYANYIFDELNDAGALGLNIVFLFGHDHSHGWDNYLGGSSIYLKKGDSIRIAQASRSVIKNETLNFTYMNAGYTGYYSSSDGADSTLTMTLFEFGEETMTVRRFDAEGLHVLKGAGTYCSEHDDRDLLPSDLTVYNSPHTYGLCQNVLSKGWFEDDAFGVAAYCTCTGIEVDALSDPDAIEFFGDPERFTDYTVYSVEPVGESIGAAILRVPYDEFGSESVNLFLKTNGVYERIRPAKEDGRLVFTSTLPAVFALALPNDPAARSAYADFLFQAEEGDGGLYLRHISTDRYLTCNGNATFAESGAPLTVTSVTGGCKIALMEATGGKAAGESLHFGTANRCSFGEYSPFVFYRFSPGDVFLEEGLPQAGSVYLIVYVNGSNQYALTGRVNGSGTSSRIETEAISMTAADPERLPWVDSAFLPYLYKVGESGGALTFKHLDSASHLNCNGNATLSSAPAGFTVTAYGSGMKVALAEATGGKAAGDALHLGTGYRVSFGDATALKFYEYVENDTFREIVTPQAGQVVMFVFEKDGAQRALTGTVYNSGTSSRIETGVVTIPIHADFDKCDLDRDGRVTIADVTVLLDYLSGNKSGVAAGANADVNGSGAVSIADVTCLLDALS